MTPTGYDLVKLLHERVQAKQCNPEARIDAIRYAVIAALKETTNHG